MKKGKNILLLIGIICSAGTLLFNLYRNISWIHEEAYFWLIYALNIVFDVLILFFPVMLLSQNLRNESKKAFAISTIIVSCVGLCLSLVEIVAALPQFLLYSHLDFIQMMFALYIENGVFTLLIGFLLLLIGSICSLPKKKKQAEISEEAAA